MGIEVCLESFIHAVLQTWISPVFFEWFYLYEEASRCYKLMICQLSDLLLCINSIIISDMVLKLCTSIEALPQMPKYCTWVEHTGYFWFFSVLPVRFQDGATSVASLPINFT